MGKKDTTERSEEVDKAEALDGRGFGDADQRVDEPVE